MVAAYRSGLEEYIIGDAIRRARHEIEDNGAHSVYMGEFTLLRMANRAWPLERFSLGRKRHPRVKPGAKTVIPLEGSLAFTEHQAKGARQYSHLEVDLKAFPTDDTLFLVYEHPSLALADIPDRRLVQHTRYVPDPDAQSILGRARHVLITNSEPHQLVQAFIASQEVLDLGDTLCAETCAYKELPVERGI